MKLLVHWLEMIMIPGQMDEHALKDVKILLIIQHDALADGLLDLSTE